MLPEKDKLGFFHPRNEEDVAALIERAYRERQQLRVRGSAHSIAPAIYSDARLGVSSRNDIDVVLDHLAEVRIAKDGRSVTAQGGVRFGRDPRDPWKRSHYENGLCRKLSEAKLALPNLGGISHQTVAGFLSTGSAGGSVIHNVGKSVASFRLIDGKGQTHLVEREKNPEHFSACGVSLGLLGVITEVTFETEPRYFIVGSETTYRLSDAPFDVFGSGAGSLEALLSETPYARILWWPQRGVDKLVVWQARRMTSADFTRETGSEGDFIRRPYEVFDPVFGTTVPMQMAAGSALWALGNLRHVADGLRVAFLDGSRARDAVRAVHSSFINGFVPMGEPKTFWDTWWQGLAMDEGIDERFLPTSFTELWIPLSRTGEAMRRLHEHYGKHGGAATRDFTCEIYASGESDFWLSPGFGEAHVRFNFFWMDRTPGDPSVDYFQQFWQLLGDLAMRTHWGKHMPRERAALDRITNSYPRIEDFLELRREFDPHDIFLTE